MYSKNRIFPSTKSYWDNIGDAAECLRKADRVIIGIGSGMSAAGGLNYADPALVERWFPEYHALGLRTILDIQRMFWWQSQSNLTKYWGYWARHIWHIRFETAVTAPYQDLFALLQNKNYFICTTNADGQVQKAGFAKEKIFAPQGNYEFLQCTGPCTQEIYEDREMVEQMISNMPSAMEIRPEDIPRCPRCGRPLVPNLRCDDTFVEQPHLWNLAAYQQFVKGSIHGKTVFLELGVGYNTPGIIRYPFERMTAHHRGSTLIRINLTNAEVPGEIAEKSICLETDLGKAVADLRSTLGDTQS